VAEAAAPPRPLAPPAARPVCEVRAPGPVPLYIHPDWAGRFPWLVQGTTGRGDGPEPFDLRLFGGLSAGTVLERWRALRGATGCARAVHARQVHGARILVHEAGPPGLFIGEGADGHVTRAPGVLLTVSVADCVPVSLVAPRAPAIALLHAGWRGVAAGVLEAGAEALARLAGSGPAEWWLHLGPAICGRCYEVGAEVHRALGLEPERAGPTVDLRERLAARAHALGIPEAHISVSAHCTRCGPGAFFSHRAGAAGRQLGILGLRPEPGVADG